MKRKKKVRERQMDRKRYPDISTLDDYIYYLVIKNDRDNGNEAAPISGRSKVAPKRPQELFTRFINIGILGEINWMGDN